jgi:aspartate racemase
MKGGFYESVFEKVRLEISVPPNSDQEYIHGKYMTELVNGIVLEDTRAELIRIAVDMKRMYGIDCLILGGTELPLILRDASGIGIPLLDTTAIHVSEIVRAIIDETR